MVDAYFIEGISLQTYFARLGMLSGVVLKEPGIIEQVCEQQYLKKKSHSHEADVCGGSNPLKIRFSISALEHVEWALELRKWNPTNDPKIHSIGLTAWSSTCECWSVEFCPALNPFYWGENPTNARLLYRLAKQLFEVFECDEMVGSSDHYEEAFHFIRGAPQQRVLTYAEEDRLPTEQEIQDDTWYAWWPTERVFPKHS